MNKCECTELSAVYLANYICSARVHLIKLLTAEYAYVTLYRGLCTRAVQKVSDLNFFRLNKSSTGSVLHCGCGGDIYTHVWISSCLQIASVAGSRSMIVYVLWALGGLSIIAKWWNELSSVIALNFAKSLAILKLKLFERFNRLSGTMPSVSYE